LKAVIRELGERQGNPIRRLEGVLPYLRAEPAGHAAVALGMLEQAEAGR
jgi:hypothetical protein